MVIVALLIDTYLLLANYIYDLMLRQDQQLQNRSTVWFESPFLRL